MAFDEVGEDSLRKTTYDNAIKQLAIYSYKMKQLVSTVSSDSWKNYFFRESTDIPTGQSGNAIKGIPRGADFPDAVLSWEQVSSRIEKYGLSGKIDHEDIIAKNIDTRNRTIKRLAEGVAKAAKPVTQLDVVVYLPVEADGVAPAGAGHGLGTSGDVNNAQPPMPQSHRAVKIRT